MLVTPLPPPLPLPLPLLPLPGAVPALLVPAALVHPSTPPVSATRSISIASTVRQRRRGAGMPKSRRHAEAATPAAYQGTPGSSGWTSTELVGAVVEIVRVDAPAEAPVMPTLVGLKVGIGTTVVPGGVVEKTAVSATLPVKPPIGVTVIVVVPLAPALTLMLPLSVRAKLTAAVAVPLNAMLCVA